MKYTKCEKCGSTDIVFEDGAFVCQNCGHKHHDTPDNADKQIHHIDILAEDIEKKAAREKVGFIIIGIVALLGILGAVFPKFEDNFNAFFDDIFYDSDESPQVTNPYGDAFADHDHKWSDWTVITEPTCTEAGKESRSCDCGTKETRAIEAKGHSNLDDGDSCDRCGYVFVAAGLYDANNNLIASWDELVNTYGMNAEQNYYDLDKPNRSAPFNVLRNNESLVTGVKLIIGNISKIGSAAFTGCENLTNIVIPTSVTKIGYDAFHACTNLTSIEIPGSITMMDWAFRYCFSLEKIIIHDGVTRIGENTFSNCDHLTSIVIPASVTTIGDDAFYTCVLLKTIYYTGTPTKWDKITIGSGNYELSSATRYYFSATKPSDDGNYWHYVNGVPTAWGTSHQHIEIIDPAISPTCTTAGLTEGKHCSVCNEIIIAQKEIAALGHSVVIVAGVTPTCTQTGLTEGKYCSNCNEIFEEQTVIPKVDHSYGEWHVIPANECAGGEYSIRVCAFCLTVDYSENYTGILHPHDFEMKLSESTCTTSGGIQIICKKCKLIGVQEVLSPLGHDLHWISNKDGHYLACQRDNCNYKTSLEAHSMTGASPCVDATCTVCGYYVQNGLGHIWSDEYKHDAKGHWIECARENCNQTTSYGIHQHKGAICTDTSASCDICKNNFVPNGSHGMGEWTQIKAPTCVSTGEMRRNCEYCNYYETKRIGALGHKFDAWYITKEPTETENGTKRRDCKNCDYYETIVVAATGHHLGNWYVTKEPTCTQSGEKRRDCTHCDYYETLVISAFGHSCSNWIQTKAPNCTESGSSYGYCSRCGEYMTRNDSPLDHAWSSYLNDNTHHWKVCTRCNVQTTRTAHSGGQNTCTEAAKCSACEYVYGQAIGHNYETKYTISDNTHYYRCKNGCDINKDEAVHKLIAKSESTQTTDDGEQIKYTHKLYMECEVCLYQKVVSTIVGAEHYGVEILYAVEPTCTQTGLTWGWKCSVAGCDEIYQAQTVIPALGHNYVNGVCTRCGVGGGNNPSTPDTHTCVGLAWVTVVEPTCIAEGEKHLICSCGKTLKTETISELGHTYASVVTAPTCTEQGYTTHICHCGVSYIDTYTDPQHKNTDNNSVCDVCEYVFAGLYDANDRMIVLWDELVNTHGMNVTKNYTATTCHYDITSPFYVLTENKEFASGVKLVIGNVDSIGNYAFAFLGGITSITITDSVTSIGDHAFTNSAFESITLGNSVTSIGNGAFGNCINLTSLTLGNGVNSIGASAFWHCISLTSIVIPDSVTSIGASAFADCTSLAVVTIGNSITNIGVSAFESCSSLTSIVIPDSVTSIYESAFEDCNSLTSIVIPDSVASIGNYAFRGCLKLVEVYNLSSLTITVGSNNYGQVGYYALNIYTDANAPSKLWTTDDGFIFYEDGDICYLMGYAWNKTDITLPDNCHGKNYEIYKYAFYHCYNLTSIKIPDGVTIISSFAFYGCSSLTSVTIPDGVTIISTSAFAECSSLTSVTIPDGVTIINTSAFAECSSLTNITIPDSVTYIDSRAFSSCSSLESITVDENNPEYRSESNCLIEKSTNTLILGCKSSVIPDSVTNIGYYAFYGCSSLTNIAIPDSVTHIFPSAFSSCSSLTNITIPDRVTSIDTGTFSFCSNLTSVIIPDSVTNIDPQAFLYCRSLTSITYKGTIAEWNAITKSSSWNDRVPATEVICSDGTVTL